MQLERVYRLDTRDIRQALASYVARSLGRTLTQKEIDGIQVSVSSQNNNMWSAFAVITDDAPPLIDTKKA